MTSGYPIRKQSSTIDASSMRARTEVMNPVEMPAQHKTLVDKFRYNTGSFMSNNSVFRDSSTAFESTFLSH